MSDCKLYYLYFCGFDAFSPWSLVYISVEKYIAITYPSRRYLLKKKKSQIIYIVVLFVSNVLYRWFYLPFSVDLIPTIKSDNSTTVSCYYLNMEWSDLVNFTDAANCVVVPFFLMSFFSVLLGLFFCQEEEYKAIILSEIGLVIHETLNSLLVY